MGCSFNYVVVPPEVQKVGELRKFCEDYRDSLYEKYGEDFEGYSGDMAVDDGTLKVRKDLVLEYEGEVTREGLDERYDDLLGLCEGVCVKWGPSVAVRVGKQWVICGAYSD